MKSSISLFISAAIILMITVFSCSKEQVLLTEEDTVNTYKESLLPSFDNTEEGRIFTDSLVQVAKSISIDYIRNFEQNGNRRFTFADPNRKDCFTLQDVRECRKCISNISADYSPSSPYCISHFDYMTSNDDGIVDYVDNVVTMRDFQYVRAKYQSDCSGYRNRNLVEPIYVDGVLVQDIVPSYQPFLNEACATAWTNLTAVVTESANPYYIQNWPAYTATVDDVDKSRYTFIVMIDDPYEDDPSILAYLQVGWYMLPVNDYGGIVCQGEQLLHCFLYDELTEVWYYNQQVVRAGVLCNAQADCNYGYSTFDVDYMNYETGYLYLNQ